MCRKRSETNRFGSEILHARGDLSAEPKFFFRSESTSFQHLVDWTTAHVLGQQNKGAVSGTVSQELRDVGIIESSQPRCFSTEEATIEESHGVIDVSRGDLSRISGNFGVVSQKDFAKSALSEFSSRPPNQRIRNVSAKALLINLRRDETGWTQTNPGVLSTCATVRASAKASRSSWRKTSTSSMST